MSMSDVACSSPVRAEPNISVVYDLVPRIFSTMRCTFDATCLRARASILLGFDNL